MSYVKNGNKPSSLNAAAKRYLEKEEFKLRFTRGGKKQLDSLKDYYKVKNSGELIKLGISLLQKIKENEEGNKSTYSYV
jgi:ribose 1,5-bisphosphokinase PhnN